MAYNLSYLRNRVLNDKLDDDSIDPGIIDNFLNDTQRAIFNAYELPYMEKTFEGTLAENEFSFAFPADYSLLQSLVITGPTGHQKSLTDSYVPFRQFNQVYPTPGNNQAGMPLVWTTYARKIMFNSRLDLPYDLTIFYLKDPTDMEADGDVPDLPRVFEEILVLGAYYRTLQRNEDFDLANQVVAEYRTMLSGIIGRVMKRQAGAPMTIAQPGRIAPGRIGRRR